MKDCILIDDQDRCCDLFASHGGQAIQVSSLEETEEMLAKLLSD